ncbi:PREDICTED: complement factor H-related protein 5 [Chrysochloris asiatica]|uniref:Complement factor H-related protein 5 n=1 Tax=Chrysochloris asiatica TaxID=185453 RepID=A0A9B0T8Q3_CHRAS|nr:PREDICTED: complement factor H-related protein 5 [Chrysochloris asiatica]
MPKFENARAKSNGTRFKLNDKLDYECRGGYENAGGNTTGSLVCGNDGWSDTPTCYEQVKSCGPPPQLINGEVKEAKKEEYKHKEVVEYDCNPKFLLKGSKKIQCVDGEWTTLPICVEEESTCGDIPTLEHGYSLPSEPPYHHGTVVEFSCEDSFTMNGYKFIRCVLGVWTELPQCIVTEQLKKCILPRLRKIESVSPPDQIVFNHTDIFIYKCKGKSETRQSTCKNGMWDPTLTCEGQMKQLCPPPPLIPNTRNMTVTVNYKDGEKISILCQENYIIQEADEIMCSGGKWQSVPRCVDSEGKCGAPPPIDNGDITSFPLHEYAPGSLVQYQCQSFYTLQGTDYVTCMNGQWSAPPKCLNACVISKEEMDIRNLELRWKYDEKVYSKTGDTVEFRCKWRYYPVTSQDSFRAVCHEGKLEYPQTCSKSDIHIDNGFISESEFTYPVSKRTQYKCKPGYVTADEFCEMPKFENARAKSNGTWFKLNDKLDYECRYGYENAGGNTTGSLVCGDDGWSDTPTCYGVLQFTSDAVFTSPLPLATSPQLGSLYGSRVFYSSSGTHWVPLCPQKDPCTR